MSKLKITWSNGDEEEVYVADEYAKGFKNDFPDKNGPYSNWNTWSVFFVNMSGGLNMAHARRVILEDDEDK